MAKGPYSTINPDTGPEAVPQVSVTIGSVPPDNEDDPLVRPPVPTSIFADYIVRNRYEKDGHIYMMPVASPGGIAGLAPAPTGQATFTSVQGISAAFVQLAVPTLLWISDWTCSRWKLVPKIPDPNVLNPNWVLLDEHIEPGMVVLTAGKIPLYRISGTYVYGCVNPSRSLVNNITFARPPWLKDEFPRLMSIEDYEQNIINNVAIPGGG